MPRSLPPPYTHAYIFAYTPAYAHAYTHAYNHAYWTAPASPPPLSKGITTGLAYLMLQAYASNAECVAGLNETGRVVYAFRWTSMTDAKGTKVKRNAPFVRAYT